MKKTYIFLLLIIFSISLCSLKIFPGLEKIKSSKAKTAYDNLDPTSVVQHFAFYKLYPNTPEGKKALEKAWSLLQQTNIHILL